MTPLDGGPKDETPPLVLASSPDSAQLNVALDARRIELQFDEYVQAKDIRNLLILSPNVEGGLDTEVKGKRLIVTLNNDLQSNTTYSLQINGSITDVNENNVLEDFQLFFSTGDYIDSLVYQARIIDAFKRSACEDCIIALYREQKDSAVILSRPDYIGRTSKSGIVRISNLAPQSFMAVAIQDKNKNLKLDFDEQIALSRSVMISDSMAQDSFYIFPYQREPEIKWDLHSDYPGKVNIVFTAPVDRSLSLFDGSDSLAHRLSLKRDTLSALVSVQKRDSIPLILQVDTILDTLWYLPPKKKVNQGISVTWIQGHPLQIRFPIPGQIDSTAPVLIQDSVPLSYESEVNSALLEIKAKWNEDLPLQLILPDSFYIDMNGRASSLDTLRPSLGQALNSLMLDVTLTDSQQHIIQLLKDQNVVHRVLRNEGEHSVQFDRLQPGTYRVRIIRDSNANGRWDPGQFLQKIKAEDLLLSSEIEVRENWDNKLIIRY